MPSYVIPPDDRAVGTPNPPGDMNDAADMLGLLTQVLAQLGGYAPGSSVPADNAANVAAVEALQGLGTITTVLAQSLASSVGSGPYYSAHRGGGSVQGGGIYQGPYPEETMEGFRAAVTAGAVSLNVHCRMLADGALVCMHDSTPDRTTNASGSVNVANYMTTSWRELSVTPQNATLWPGYAVNWGSMRPPYLEEVLSEFGGKVLLLIEATSGAWQATGTVGAAITAALVARGMQSCAIITSFAAAELTVPAAAGIQTMYFPPNYGSTGYLPSAIAAAMTSGWGSGLPHNVGINAYGGTETQIAAYIPTLNAAEFTVWAWVVDHRYDVSWLNTAGCNLIITDEPVYLPSATPVNRAGYDPTSIYSPNSTPAWPHGLLQADSNEGRGNILASGGGIQLDYTAGTSVQQWVCRGDLAPVTATTYTVSTTVVYSQIDSDTSRWAGLYICCPDDRVTSGVASVGTYGFVNGYTIILRCTGQLGVFKNNFSSQTQSQVGSYQATQSITTGQSATLSVEVTPTQIIITPTVNGTGYGPFTFNDSTYRGGYFHLGKAIGATGTKLIVTHTNVTA
jgi:glycerophosphoryl diester phosphodiesterase